MCEEGRGPSEGVVPLPVPQGSSGRYTAHPCGYPPQDKFFRGEIGELRRIQEQKLSGRA